MTDPFAGNAPTVLQIVPALETGGAERTTLDIARALVAAGGTALVASRGGRMVAELEAIGGRHIELPIQSKNPVVMALNVERLTRVISRQGADLVHARSRAPAWSALAAARRTGKPFVTTYHSRVHDRPRLKVFYNSVMTRGDAVIANSAYTAKRIRAVHKPDEARIFTVPRGVDTAFFDPATVPAEKVRAMRAGWNIGDGTTVFLLPARLTRWKGQAVAIEAAAKLATENNGDFVLVLLGDAQGRDAYAAELNGMVTAAGLEARVRIAGHGDDMATAYAAADIVLAPSVEPEPFGRVAAEAQAMTKPVVVSDAGGARETVRTSSEGQETGWRIAPGDAAALAVAMRAALASGPQERAAMGAHGRQNVLAHFSVEAMCAATLDVYARLLARN